MKILGYILLFPSVVVSSHVAFAQPGCIGFNADFSFKNDYTKEVYPTKIILTNTSLWTDSTTRYNWNYGDGNTSTVKEAAHIYSTIGQYNVCLFAVNVKPNGDTTCRDLQCYPVKIEFDTCIITGDFTFAVDSADCHKYSFKPVNQNYNLYQWDFGNSDTSIAKLPAKNYPHPGTYTVCLKTSFVYNGNKTCRDSICKQIEVCKGLLAEESEVENAITVYPVPFNDYIMLSGVPIDKTAKLCVYDVYGRIVINELIDNSAKINTDYLPKGLYIVEITDGTQVLERQKAMK